MYKAIEFKIVGVAPLLMHNGQLADPLNPWTKKIKEVSGKRKKTDADHAELSRIEWFGGLYVDDSGAPCIPGTNLESMLIEAGKKQKMGEPFKAGVICDGNFPLTYDGPKDPEKLWESKDFRDVRGVRVSMAKIMRTRPIFRKWSLKFTAHYLPDVLNESNVTDAVKTAGRIIGLCDYTPKFGRFEIQ